MSKNNGGPAFPTTKESHLMICSEGMTLRDYFAAKAMQGMLEMAEYRDLTSEGYARGAYRVADAMLAEREKDNE
jgi:hypothetical protein